MSAVEPPSDLADRFTAHDGHLSDKWEQYLAIFGAELQRFVRAGEPVRLLEIGVQNGGSLQLWAQHLPAGSSVVGIDVDPQCATLELGEGIQVLIADASDPAELDRALGHSRFNVVIDDGSHRSDHIIGTFEACFDRVEPGGLYVVEDLHCSYLAAFGGGLGRPGAAVEWFKTLVDAMNADHFEHDVQAQIGEPALTKLDRLGRHIARISFFDSMVIVEKLAAARQAPYRRFITGRHAPLTPPADIVRQLPQGQLGTLLLSASATAVFTSPLVRLLGSARAEAEALRGALAQREMQADQDGAALREALGQRDDSEVLREQAMAARDVLEAELVSMRPLLARAQISLADAGQQVALSARRAEAAMKEAAALAGKADTDRALTMARAEEAQALQLESARRVRAAELNEQAANQRAEALTIRAEQAEARSHALLTSTSWKLTRPIRGIAGRLPARVRRGGRWVLSAGWAAAGLGGRAGAGRAGVAARGEIAEAEPAPTSTEWIAGPIVPDPLVAMTEPDAPRQEAAADLEQGTTVRQPDDALTLYASWCLATDPSPAALALQRRIASGFTIRPKFSVLVPVFRVPADVFSAMLESVRAQSYPDWELCVALVDTGADAVGLLDIARLTQAADTRVKLQVLDTNFGISGNSNVALEMVTGDWTVLLDHDDLLSPDALFQFARVVNAGVASDLIYSDKDMVSRDGGVRFAPLLKPSWSPEVMLNANYLTHACALRTERLRAVGGWDPATDGAQDWDLFLRVIGPEGHAAHVPRVLYHWRHIETSVAVAGFRAKPFAAAGQLRALSKYLPLAGWPGAMPRFDGPYIRIVWPIGGPHHVSVVVVGGVAAATVSQVGSDIIGEVLSAEGPDLAVAVDLAIARARNDVVVLVDAGFIPDEPVWIDELALPLANPAIAAVAGRVFDEDGGVIDYGMYVEGGSAYPALRGEPDHYSGLVGGAGWYRNALAAAGGALAFRREAWRALGGFSAVTGEGRADVAFTLRLTQAGRGRLMINPFARFRSAAKSAWERTAPPLSRRAVLDARPDRDPFLNPCLDGAVDSGEPLPRMPAAAEAATPGHDFAAEARYIAATYDATGADITASIAACARAAVGPLRRVIWLLPDFLVAFYGGIFTILRAAEYMRQRHAVTPVLAVLSERTVATLTAKIAEALPALAAAAEIVTFTSTETLPDLGEADGAVCTLWITAFPLLQMRGVRRKFYFLQDWEPGFYPGGTISTAVEATYRFGFHAVCNTPALASSYAALGGTGDFFLPAVDQAVFHPRGRRGRAAGEPFVLVCYIRPRTPRNCFEAVTQALGGLKRQYGEGLLIVSAGAEWDPVTFGLDGIVENLGLLPYAETGALYRAADAGLVAMATRHPSYLPFELMACGAAVVTNRNLHTSWFLRDGRNSLLCEMTRGDIIATASRLIEDPALRDRLVAEAAADIVATYGDWDVSCERIHSIMCDVAERPCLGRH